MMHIDSTNWGYTIHHIIVNCCWYDTTQTTTTTNQSYLLWCLTATNAHGYKNPLQIHCSALNEETIAYKMLQSQVISAMTDK